MRAVACTEAPAAAKEHSTGQEERAGHPQSVSHLSEAASCEAWTPSERRTPQRNGIPEPLSSPSPSAASLEKLRAEVGSKATGETLKLSREAVEASTSALQAFGNALLTLKLSDYAKPHPKKAEGVHKNLEFTQRGEEFAKTAVGDCYHQPTFAPCFSGPGLKL